MGFANVQGRKVEADFEGGAVTSDGGALFLRVVEAGIGVIRRLVRAVRDRRHASYIDHTMKDLISQRVYQIACGYEDANDADTLQVDPGFKTACRRASSLDVDDTNDATHGAQQLALFSAFYNEYGYQPLHIYEGQSGKLITTILRPGCRPTGAQIEMLLKRVVAYLGQAGNSRLKERGALVWLRPRRCLGSRARAIVHCLFLSGQ